jgi:Tol biopolymer transport system component
MRPDGTGDEPLVTGPATQSHPAYAPDGSRMALVEDAADGSTLRVVGPDGGELAAVPAPAGGGRWRAPAWIPSGDGLVVELTRPGGSVLHRAPAAGGPTRELVAGADPAFGPDGRLWWSRSDSVFHAEWEDAGPVRPRLATTPGRTPAPAPDGVRLAFVRDGADGAALWILDLGTGEERRATAPPARPAP